MRRFLNVGSDDDFKLLVTVLVSYFFPAGPYPVLLLQGEQGSAKSTTARVLDALLDPSVPPLRAQPRDGRDLMVAANNRWLLVFDNLSELTPWLSDAFCRLATGGGISTRELYTDDEEALFDAHRPVILTGIDDLVARSDLLDRTILLLLPHITEEARETEAEFWAAFEAARPCLLGALLDCVVATLAALPEIKPARLPRLADFAKRGAALAPSIGWTAEEFLAAYEDNRHVGHVTALEASSVAQAIVTLLSCIGVWRGTATELLESLNMLVPDEKRRAKNWPRSARGMSSALRRVVPNLRAFGLTVEFGRTTGRDRTRNIAISKEAVALDGSTEQSDPSERDSGQTVRLLPGAEERPREASDHFGFDADDADDADGLVAAAQHALFELDADLGRLCAGCGDPAALKNGLCCRCKASDERHG